MKFNYKTVIATAALVALTSPLMVKASIKSTHMETSEIVIRYHASELNSVTGQARIERHIRQAARKVCGKVARSEAGSVRNVTVSNACYHEAVDTAMSSIGGFAVTSR